MAFSEYALQRRSERKKKQKNHQNYPEATKLLALKTYMATGSYRTAGIVANVPSEVLNSWRNCVWWMEGKDAIEHEEDVVITNKMKTMVDLAMAATQDRLENGEWVMDNKNGELKRKPVAIKDSHKVGMDLLKTRREIRNAPSRNSANQEGTEDKLIRLAERFAEIAQKRFQTVEADITDITPNEEN